jgi:hypothetical protein
MSELRGETSTQNTCPEEPATTFLTYRKLFAYHDAKYRAELKQNGKPESAANNHQTAATKWLECAPWLNAGKGEGEPLVSASLDDAVGVEFGVDFEGRRDEHLRRMEAQGLAQSTINARKHILGRLQESWEELLAANELPDGFSEALGFLIEKHGVSQRRVASWCGLHESVISAWIAGTALPSRNSLKHVTTIERRFRLQPGTLVFKVPLRLRCGGTRRGETRNTPFRQHQAVIALKPYRLPYDSFTPEQKNEWEEFRGFYSDSDWAARGLGRRGPGWRTRQDDNTNPTAEIKRRNIENLYGYACLPAEPADPKFRGVKFDPEDKSHVGVRGLDPHLTGLGMEPSAMTLALFTDAVLINKLIKFKRGRSFGNSHNTATQEFLALCVQLTRPEEGFLYQFPEYGRRLDPPILSKEEWQEKCREAHKRITNLVRSIRMNRNEQERFNQTRDTMVEVIQPLVRAREHPITVLTEIAEGLRYDFKRAGTFEDKALLFRNLILVELATSNPVRVLNIAGMRYKVGARGTKNDPTNLYKLPDGSYRLKYEPWELKNGATKGRYDLPINDEIVEDLDRYFSEWRPRLFGAAVCDYVFRPAVHTLPSLLARNPKAAGRAMNKSGLSEVMRFASQKYITNCAGFGIHCARHFVATEYLKLYPGAYEIPATALHDSVEVVKKAYSWVSPDDVIVFWNAHLSPLLRAARRGAA